jgi:lipid-binding SYLF domain-containing protein
LKKAGAGLAARGIAALAVVSGLGVVAQVHGASAASTLTQVSSDPFTNTTAEHHTELEPDTYTNGSTVVGVFQVGRFSNGGADDIGWATSTDSGKTWQHGFLQGITKIAGGGTFDRVSDPTVVYNAKTKTWLASGLVITGTTGVGVVVSSSSDGVTWSSHPVVAYQIPTTGFLDKDWITCDNTSSSPHYGNCYIEADRADLGDQVNMVTSTDGGATWGSPQVASTPLGLGGQPVVQPNGTVVVPYLTNGGAVRSFKSTDGGTTWGGGALVSQTVKVSDPGMRSSALPSAQIDGAGKVYVAWEDCRFRTGCSSNDIVFSTSADGTTWSSVSRVPVDAVASTVDHFNPGIGVDRSTSGATAHLGVYYYFFPNIGCSAATCQLEVGFVASTDGGSTWGAPATVAGPMKESQLAHAGGAFVGDYQACGFAGGNAFSVFSVGKAKSGGMLNEGMWAVVGGK